MTRYCLSYKLASDKVPSHVPGGPLHGYGHKLVVIEPDQLDDARLLYPEDDPRIGIIEHPENGEDEYNIVDWYDDHSGWIPPDGSVSYPGAYQRSVWYAREKIGMMEALRRQGHLSAEPVVMKTLRVSQTHPYGVRHNVDDLY